MFDKYTVTKLLDDSILNNKLTHAAFATFVKKVSNKRSKDVNLKGKKL